MSTTGRYPRRGIVKACPIASSQVLLAMTAPRAVARRMRRPSRCFTRASTQLPELASFFPTIPHRGKQIQSRCDRPSFPGSSRKTTSGRRDMARMRAIDAAVRILEREGVTTAFGVPGAAINPLYSALKRAARSGTFWRVMSRARRTWPTAIPAPRPAISASASAPRSGRHRHDHRALFRAWRIRSRSSASPARRRARGSIRRTSRPSISSRSPSR